MDEARDRLSEIVLSRYDLIASIARYYVRSPDQVADVVQQVCLEFVTHGKRWDLESDPDPLLNRLTRNVAMNHVRNRFRYSSEGMRKIVDLLLDRAARKEVDKESFLEDQLRALNRCLEQLSDKKRGLLDMHYRAGKTVRTISEELGAKEKTVSKTICRIREALKTCIESHLKALDQFDGSTSKR